MGEREREGRGRKGRQHAVSPSLLISDGGDGKSLSGKLQYSATSDRRSYELSGSSTRQHFFSWTNHGSEVRTLGQIEIIAGFRGKWLREGRKGHVTAAKRKILSNSCPAAAEDARLNAVTDVPQHPSFANPHSGPLCPSRSSLGRSRCIQAELFTTETKLESQRAPIRPSPLRPSMFPPSLSLSPFTPSQSAGNFFASVVVTATGNGGGGLCGGGGGGLDARSNGEGRGSCACVGGRARRAAQNFG